MPAKRVLKLKGDWWSDGFQSVTDVFESIWRLGICLEFSTTTTWRIRWVV